MSANAENADLQPDRAEVLQQEEPDESGMPPVNVRIVGTDVPQRIQRLPRKGGTTFSKTVLAAPAVPVRLLLPDHRRARATLISVGQNLLIAFSQASAQDPSRMALWPASVPFMCDATTEIWVLAATGTTTISVATELWATGEDGGVN